MRYGVALALLAVATAAAAHTVGLSRGDYRADGAAVRTDVVFARPELAAAIPALDADRDGAVSPSEIAAARGPIAAWAERGIVVRAGDEPCRATLTAVAPTESDGVALTLVHRCPRAVSAYDVRLDLLASLSLGHRHVATLTSAAAVVRGVLFEQHPELALGGGEAANAVAVGAPSPFRRGVARAFAVDHVLYLLVLLAAGGTLHATAGRALAFTLAHSLTFVIAALGYWTPPAAWIAPASGLGMMAVTIGGRSSAPHRRWRAAFAAGLAHGCGLAATLVEAVPSATPAAVVGFHAGVESGQLALLLVVLRLAAWPSRARRLVVDAPGVASIT